MIGVPKKDLEKLLKLLGNYVNHNAFVELKTEIESRCVRLEMREIESGHNGALEPGASRVAGALDDAAGD